MKVLSKELRNVQNPALGASLLWRFVCGFTQSSKTSEPVPIPLLFIVLPILLHRQTEEVLKATQATSGLRAFATKFGESKVSKQDLLLGLHNRAVSLKSLTLLSLRLALSARLVATTESAYVVALTTTEAASGIGSSVKRLMKGAEKLGRWCSELTFHEISTTLKVKF